MSEINDLLELLSTYRKTLHHWRMQQAIHGTAYAPPSVMHGIREARTAIGRTKQQLRTLGHEVDDYPDEDDGPASGRSAAPAHPSPPEPGTSMRTANTQGGDYAEGNIDKRQYVTNHYYSAETKQQLLLIWKMLSPQQQTLLRQIASGLPIAQPDQALVSELHNKGLLDQTGKIFSSTFVELIRHELSQE